MIEIRQIIKAIQPYVLGWLEGWRVRNQRGGWELDVDTWVYVGAGQFEVVGKDVTERFPMGTKLRCKQGGAWLYFYVVGAVFGTSTLVTVTGGTDYSLSNAAITDGWFSYSGPAAGFPGWFNYAIEWYSATSPQPAIGNGTLTGRFSANENTVRFRWALVVGSTTTFGTGAWNFTLPPILDNRAWTYNAYGIVRMIDSAATTYVGVVNSFAMATNRFAPSSHGMVGGVTATAPFTWASGNRLFGNGFYEV